ncbi:MAG: hypothetical protein RLZZ618_2356 [Pseudomonadota bacterium]
MIEWLPLSEVVSRSGLSERVVAWQGGALLRRDRFLSDVAAWQATFASQPGARVALYFEDGYRFACALFGAWHAGKQVCLPGDVQPATLQRLAVESDLRAGDLPNALQPASASASHAPWAPLDLLHTRLVVYTSGSSGEPLAIPKGLVQLDAEMQTLQAAFGERLDAQGPVAVAATVSHQHIYGLLFCTLWPLASGRAFVAERIVYPEEMSAQLARGPAVLVSSPAHLKRLPDNLDWHGARAQLRAVFSSGGPLPPEAAESALALLGQSPIEVFGSSETGGVAWRQRADHGERWTPLPGIGWRVDNGLLSVQSRHLPDDGWMLTADRVKAQPDGGFVLLGRADRVVKIEEKRVSLTAMERALCEGGELTEARVVVVPTESGVRLAVVGVTSEAGRALLRDNKRALNERLRRAVLSTVERVALPRRFRYVDALPVNAQGKVTEALLLALFRHDLPSVVWGDRTNNAITGEIDMATDLQAFEGHFPEAPLLPGVVQVDWAVRFARSFFSMPPRLQRMSQLKFQRPVVPGMRVQLTLQWNDESRVLSFAYSSDGGKHAGGSLLFAPHDDHAS